MIKILLFFLGGGGLPLDTVTCNMGAGGIQRPRDSGPGASKDKGKADGSLKKKFILLSSIGRNTIV